MFPTGCYLGLASEALTQRCDPSRLTLDVVSGKQKTGEDQERRLPSHGHESLHLVTGNNYWEAF